MICDSFTELTGKFLPTSVFFQRRTRSGLDVNTWSASVIVETFGPIALYLETTRCVLLRNLTLQNAFWEDVLLASPSLLGIRDWRCQLR